MAGAVTAGLVLSGAGMRWLDPVVAFGVVGLVTWRGWDLVWRSAAVLSDAAGADVDAIARMASGIAGVGDVHAVRCRGELGRVRVDLHIHVDPDLTVAQAHAIARAVAERVTAGLGGICEVLVHIGAGERHAVVSSARSEPERPLGSHEAAGSPPSQDSR
jgi:divalent metal cation (Fe/Co/Zn/Cd) transporter